MTLQSITNFLLPVLTAFWNVLSLMAPYLLLGFAISFLLARLLSMRWVQNHLGRDGALPVIKASLLGVPLPLCSCGVLPVAFSLSRSGASKGATVSFLASTPQIGVTSILATWSILGPVITFMRMAAAFLSGITAGLLTNLFNRGTPPATPPTAPTCPKCKPPEPAPKPACPKCAAPEEPSGTPAQKTWGEAFRHAFITLPGDMAKTFLVGVFLTALLTVLIPENRLQEYLPPGILSYFAALLIGLPIYTCSTAAVPIAALLIHAGVSPGAAFVFLVAGPATNMVVLTTLWRELGRAASLCFIAGITINALAGGFIVDTLLLPYLPQNILGADACCSIPESSPLPAAAAVLLLAIFAIPLLTPLLRRLKPNRR